MTKSGLERRKKEKKQRKKWKVRKIVKPLVKKKDGYFYLVLGS